MASRRPNILHIFTDQQRFDTVHALGNPVIRTPRLDRLCREGTAFTSAYSPSPVCVPARCSMIYGQYPASTGCYENHAMPADGRESFMDALARAGYHTEGIGKCHFMDDAQAMRGFHHRVRQEEYIRSVADDDYFSHLRANPAYDHIATPLGIRDEMYYQPQVAPMAEADHPTQWIGDRAVDFLRGRGANEQPWYLYCGFIAPHPPLILPERWFSLYPPVLMPLPHVPAQHESLLTWINHFQNRYKFRDQGADLHQLRTLKGFYYAAISFVDYQVGRLLDELERQGRLDDTLIVFSSDHGEFLGDYGCHGKRSMHDVSARVPLICRQPGRFPAGVRVDTVASLVDLAPTFCAAASATVSTHELEGRDLAALAAGDDTRDTVFSHYGRHDHAIYAAVTRRWKYVFSAADRREFLFDRVEDPDETRDRSGLIHCREILAALRVRMHEYLRSRGQTEVLEGEGWRHYDGIRLGPEWKWWPMRAPWEVKNLPDASLLQNISASSAPADYQRAIEL